MFPGVRSKMAMQRMNYIYEYIKKISKLRLILNAPRATGGCMVEICKEK